MYTIEDLPNEIIYRIFNNTDLYSIISFGSTCKRFFHCFNHYNSYQINFESITKRRFDLICRVINPSNIISLKLSDDDQTPGQIKTFIKNFQINKLNRLRTLQLIKVNENDLENILKNFLNNSLNFLQIEYRQYFTLLNSSTISILSQILSLKTLKKVQLDMRSYHTDFIPWSQSSNIEDLILVHLNLNQFIQILQKSNRFKSIILRDLTMKEFTSKLISLKELKSFQIEESELIFENIQWLLLLMNQLVYLRFEGNTNFTDKIFHNDRFENFIQTNLINLKAFQFFFRFTTNQFIRNQFPIELFMKQFQKSFWIENLNCFVNCDVIQNSNETHCYSIPCSYHYFKYSDQFNMISLSTSSSLHQRFDSIYQMDLNLKDLETMSLQIKNSEEDNRLCPKLNYLKLTINDQCPENSFELLSKLIHLKHLVKIVLIICSRGDYLKLMMKNFLIILKELPSLNSIEIFNRWHGIFSSVDIKYFCSMVPVTLKHLDIDILDMNHIQILIERLEHVSSFKFKFSFEKSIYVKDILEWFSTKKINSAYISDIHYLSIWVSNRFNRTNQNKRIKLSH